MTNYEWIKSKSIDEMSSILDDVCSHTPFVIARVIRERVRSALKNG